MCCDKMVDELIMMCPACRMFRNEPNRKMHLADKSYLSNGQIQYAFCCHFEKCHCVFEFRKDGYGEKPKVGWKDV